MAATLYANRAVLNAADIIAWAKGQGFATTLEEHDLHVTVAYSKEPFDWSGIVPDQTEILAAGDRSLEAFGKDGQYVVLTFDSPALQARFQEFADAGASWSWPSFQPHITITSNPGDADIAAMDPYAGPIMLGPERFSEIDDEWSSKVTEKMAKEHHQMANLKMFIPITKIDAVQRLVYGLATAEKMDSSGEICDYASTKPFYEAWSGNISKATDGKSLGNIRAMHGSVAAGKVVSLNCNDVEKQIEICGKVVDDAEWAKVEEGVYTGFSQGGSYVKRWKDADGFQRYTASPVEVSLVDLPCLPDSTFQMVKADGTTEARLFKSVVDNPSVTSVGNRADKLAKAAGVDPGKWADFVDAATRELQLETISKALAFETETAAAAQLVAEAPAAAAVVAAPEAPAAAAAPAVVDSARKWVDPKQLWRCDDVTHEHVTKAEAVRCMKAAIVTAEVQKASGPVDAAMARLEAAVGIEPAAVVEKAAGAAADASPAATVVVIDQAGLDEARKVYDAAPTASGRRALVKLAKTLGAVASLPPDWAVGPGEPVEKGELAKEASLWGVSQMAQLLAELSSCENSLEYDSDWLGSTSANVPADLKTRFGTLVTDLGDVLASVLDVILASMAADEATEAMTRASLLTDLFKAGARHSKSDLARLQKLHDLSVELGAGCTDDEAAAKLAGGDELSKALSENTALKSQLSTLGTRLDSVMAKVDQIAAQPGAPKAALLVVRKDQDGLQNTGTVEDEASAFAKTLEGMSAPERARELMKLSLRLPINGHPDHRPA